MMPPLRPVLRSALVVVVALLLTWALAQTDLHRRAESWFGDAQQHLVASDLQASEAVVVDIDEESIRKLEPYLGVWPYRRDIFALVADYLAEAGVRAVCFDILFSERRLGDQELGAALARNRAMVFAAAALPYPLALDEAQRAQLNELSWHVSTAVPGTTWSAFTLPQPTFSSRGAPSTNTGVISIQPDADGTVRRVALLHRAGDATLPSLALAALFAGAPPPPVDYAASTRALKVGRFVWPVDAGSRVVLSFPRNHNPIPSLPFSALALSAMGAPSTPPDLGWLKGKTVFIGSTAVQTDYVNTPHGLMPGVQLLALAYEDIAGNRVLRPAGIGSTAILLLAALALPLGLSGWRPPSSPRIIVAALIGAILAFACNLVLLAGWQQQSQLLFTLTALILTAIGLLTLNAIANAGRRRHAEHQMQIASAVFDASKEGIFVTDGDNRIVSINPAFTEITGYSSDEVIGRDPGLMASGRHDHAFYDVMWRAMLADGFWQGEIWNRRKNGEIYPQWLTISSVYRPDGKREKWIALFSDISSHKAAEEKISFLAHFDALTHLPNRTLLQDRVNVAIAAAIRLGEKLTLMFLDLDRFKNINDSLGHPVGDKLLQRLAQRLTDLLREGDTASRLGGDEFIMLLPKTDADEAAHIAARICAALEEPFLIDNHELNVTVSIGIANFPADGGDLDTLSRCADSALYRAKRAGRNTFQFYTDEMHAHAREVLLIENHLRHVIERDEFVLHYQPQIDTVSERIVGLEALVRWQHPHRGLISPAHFIAIAEESGQIREIGDWVLRRALAQIHTWAEAGVPVVPVAVNLSLAQFRQSSFCDDLVKVLHASGVEPAMLELELTESLAMENYEFTVDSMDRMHALGVGLSIDDFGTGYSSLAYLKRFRVNKIKIDQSFVRNLATDKDDAAIVTSIINLAHNLGFQVIAEGVETCEQLQFLRQQHCDQIQGFFYSLPRPADEIAGLLHHGVVAAGPNGQGCEPPCADCSARPDQIEPLA